MLGLVLLLLIECKSAIIVHICGESRKIKVNRAIITGTTGAIGMALIRELLDKGFEVQVIVRPDSNRLDRLPVHERLYVLRCPLDALDTVTKEEIGSFDICYHLAWVGTIGPQRDDMSLQLKNVQYTLDAVYMAHRLNCKVFVGAGSQAEYGIVEGKLSSKTPVNPEMGYGIAKLCAGQMSRLECRRLGLRHEWTRILSIYGPYDGESTMIISGIRQMLRGQRPSFSKGEQQWDYLYSQDAARALYLIALKGKDGAVYPLGSGEAYPLYEYIETMRVSIDKKLEVGIGEFPYGERQVMYLCADIKELTEDTGFVPFVSFKEGIQNTIDWCKKTEDTK